MYSTEHQPSDTGTMMYTTEQWFRAIQARRIEPQRLPETQHNPSDSNLQGNHFLRHN
ncbi:hypothetical protein N9380_05295 [Paracoccaceae bacterium]|nr:hypothetical protein [Paracoccaceae bacterium]